MPAASTAAVALGALAVGCSAGCAAVAAHFSGFPLLVIGGCACLLAHLAVAALLVRATRAVARGVESQQVIR